MKTRLEVIMACLGEYQENLQRTINEVIQRLGANDRLTIVLDGKHDYVLEEQQQVNIVMPWEESHGPGACRHYGITHSKAENIVLIDGHMTFPDGCFDVVAKHLKKYHRDITCCHMTSLGHDWKEPQPSRDFAGCMISLKTKEVGNVYSAISAKWFPKAKQSGEVPAIMGACYGMNRDWYDKIGRPLSILRGWGQDEEILSLTTWLCGGRCWLLSIACGHVYAAPYHRPVSSQGDDSKKVHINRYAVVYSLPMPEQLRTELLQWLNLNTMRDPEIRHLLRERQQDIDKLKTYLENNAKLSWGDLQAENLISPAPPITPEQELKQLQADFHRAHAKQIQPQIVQRPVERCERCNAINPFRKTQGPREYAMFNQAYAKCFHCGHKALIRQN